MANQYWGENPEILSVESSPTPSHTVFAVSSAVSLLEEQYVLVQVDGELERTQITNISGNTLTVSPALSSVPDTPGAVQNNRELISRTKLLQGAVFGADNAADLKTVDTTYAINNLKYHLSGAGLYRLNNSSTLVADDDLVIAPTTGPGRFIQEADAGGLAGAYLAGDIQDSLPVTSASIDWASLSNGSSATSSAITVQGARSGDFVMLQGPSSLPAGFQVRGYVSAKNTVTLQAFNGTGNTQDLTAGNYLIWVITPNRIPPISRIATQQFEALLNGDYDGMGLENLLSDGTQTAHFWLLLASRWRMQALFDDSTAKTAIQGSLIANSIAETYDGEDY